MDVGLNPNHPAAAYQVGRLMAVLDDIQYSALGDVGADVVQKFLCHSQYSTSLSCGTDRKDGSISSRQTKSRISLLL